ncbi:unnamed protein product [Cylicocyclus nassatus]|uniref:Oxysterol-binding protein n=1 Tax=Cylicocyclus nassatus TaxID=53992 RepID=A0AA36HBC7_CYLNA|nr:unnamed protein product [Cylicocyclus nassatus]
MERKMESEKSSKVESKVSVSTASDFNDWNTMDMCWKMIDDIEQMQGLSVQVLEKMAALAVEMRKVANELNAVITQFKQGKIIRKMSDNKPSPTTKKQISALSASTAPTKGFLKIEEDEDIGTGLSSHDYDSDLLTADSKPSIQILHSLQATSNVEQRKDDVIKRSLKILGRSSTELLPPKTVASAKQQPSPTSTVEPAVSSVTGETSASAGPDLKTAKAPDESSAKSGKLRKIRRAVLPSPQKPSERISFAALGRMILQRSGVPLSHYEPLTALQLLCEELRHSKLLSDACSKNTAEERMVYVAAFAFSTYSNTTGRYRKFFNPLLGETYEYEQDDFKYHAEQVSHHPAVSAGHASGNGWTWFQTFSAEVTWNTWAQSCEFCPERPVRLQLGGEEYSWNKITTHIENLLCTPEQRKLYHEGTIHEVYGDVANADGEIFCRFMGNWDEKLVRELANGEREDLIIVSNWPIHAEYFGFSDFTMGLNQLDNEDEQLLPPTDSRFRPDVRHLEDGDLDKATAYKMELEKAQRTRGINEETHKPLWFEEKEDEFTKTKIFVTNGKYWEAKQTRFEKQRKEDAFIPIFNVTIIT